MRELNEDIEFEGLEEELLECADDLRKDLLDIEIKLGDGLRTAFNQFES